MHEKDFSNDQSTNLDLFKLKENLIEFCASINLEAVGIAQFPLPIKYLNDLNEDNPCPFTSGTGEERLNAATEDTTLQRSIVILFPYYINDEDLKSIDPHLKEVNLSRYTWGEDYHIVARKYLSLIQEFLESYDSNANFEIHVDTSPLADRQMAYHAGLGFYGKNNCIINPKLGSYVTIGTLLTSIPLPYDLPLTQSCLNCNACLKACPGQALGFERFKYENCKSYITQKKGELSETELAIMQKTPLIFGCDVCQDVCPHNFNLKTTPIEEFKNIVAEISPTELKEMTNRQFKAAYGNRAFSWRGKAILLRNDEIVNSKK